MSSNPPERLAMIALGIRGDHPADPEQPPLVDGIHLRWSPEQKLGFPWHGFYLFRRETRPSRPRCLKKELVENPPRPGNDSRYVTAIGTLSSPKPLVFTDDFPDSGVVEADLSAPLRFDLPSGVETGRVDLRIGFRDTPRLVRTCVDFRLLPLGSGPTPRTEEGAVFSVQPVNVVTQAPDAAIEQWNGGPAGLEFTSPVRVTYRLDIALPCRATKVDLLLSNRDAIVVQAFEAGGASTGIRRFDARTLQASPVALSGKAIDRVTIESTSVDSALLHEICWECPMTGGGTVDGPEVKVDFTTRQPHEYPNPVIDQGVTFRMQEPDVGSPLAWFDSLGHGTVGLHDRGFLTITLPCSTTRVEMFVTKATDGLAAEMWAFNEGGSLAQQSGISTFGQSKVIVEGEAIRSIDIHAPDTDLLLHTLSFRCRGTATQTIRVRGFSYENEVTQLDMTAAGGQIVVNSLVAEATTAIEIDAGKAALIDLCYTPTRQSVPFGWEPVPGFQYPLCLPVAHRDYPCVSKPPNPDAARNLALSRVTYPSPPEREQGFWKLHRELVHLVRGGPAGGPMADRTHGLLHGHPQSPATQESPSVPNLKPLDLVLLASLHPAYAQMVGLYFVDRDVDPGIAYDYLILADPTGVLGGSAKTALAWLADAPDSTQVHAELLLDRSVETRAPIAPPAGAHAYALPGSAAREIDGTVPDVAGNVGLWWPLPPETDEEEPDRIIFYDVRRAFFGATRPGSADPSQYERVPRLRAVLVSEPDPPPSSALPKQRSSDWPPPSIAMHAVDGNLAEGWYSFRIAGQDLFGRRSVPGPPAEWYQWDPPAGTPPPWYWKAPAGNRPIDPFAVALLDKVPPPAPLGVEAWALDPDDRWLLADDAYLEWRKTVPDALIGLRVRWRWTLMQQIQAPDTREFRVYWQPGRWNAILANVDIVSAAAADESYALLDIADAHAVDAFQAARLRVDDDDFAILGSDTVGPKLRLRVKNIGALDEVRPEEGMACTIAIPAGHPLFVDTSRPSNWAQRVAHVPYDPPLAIVVDASKDANGRPLTSEEFSTPLVIAGDVVRLPPAASLSGIQPWIDHLWLKDANGAEETLPIIRYDTALDTVTLKSAVTLAPARWRVGRPAREYEIFLPSPDVGPSAPFEPTLADAVVYAQVAVSAADDKVHVVDTWPGNPLGNRPGNESQLSPSATVYRVLQKPPDPPELPDSADRLWATPANWRDQSFSTFRFIQSEHLRVHVLRALDDTLLQRDWMIRETRKALDSVAHAEFFPDAMSDATRTVASTELNGFTDHASLSPDALKVLAMLPGNEGAAKLADRDALIRNTREALSASDTAFFPKSWTPATRNAVAGELNAIATPADYEALSYGALRILAGLPGNEAAFTQVTLDPLEMNAPAILDERRPDDDAQYTSPNTNIRAYTDTLPGRATNRYFYRAAFVDPAQNISALSLAGPPVYLRKVEPPRAPVITRVVGGDGTINLSWAHNRESDLLEYRVHRTDAEERAADVRLMPVVAAIPPLTSIGPDRVAEMLWSDADLVRGKTYFYRIVAVDASGNVSAPTAEVRGRAFRLSPIPPPEWIHAAWNAVNGAVELQWTPSETGLRHIVQRRDTMTTRWEPVSDWLEPDTATFIDAGANPAAEYLYRIRARDQSGNTSAAFITRLAAPQE